MHYIVDARKFYSSNGAAIALLRHCELIKSKNSIVIVADEKTAKSEVFKNSNFRIRKVSKFNYVNIVSEEIKRNPKGVIVYCPHAVSLVKNLIFKKSVKLWVWFQGLVAEEMTLRKEKKWKTNIMRVCETLSLIFSDKVVTVSEAMTVTLSEIHDIKDKSAVLPCLPRTTLLTNQVRRENSFCYIGGLSAWQCAEWMLSLYYDFFKANPESTLTIATQDVEKAKSMIKEVLGDSAADSNIEIMTLNSTQEVNELLSSKQFGFLLREDLLLNKVASPIKFGEYISCGVNPIVSEFVGDYSKLTSDYKCGVVINKESVVPPELNYSRLNALKLFNDYFDMTKYEDVFRCQ